MIIIFALDKMSKGHFDIYKKFLKLKCNLFTWVQIRIQQLGQMRFRIRIPVDPYMSFYLCLLVVRNKIYPPVSQLSNLRFLKPNSQPLCKRIGTGTVYYIGHQANPLCSLQCYFATLLKSHDQSDQIRWPVTYTAFWFQRANGQANLRSCLSSHGRLHS